MPRLILYRTDKRLIHPIADHVTNFLIELKWHRHVSGYELLPSVQPEYLDGDGQLRRDPEFWEHHTLLSARGRPARIAPCGEQKLSYEPMKNDELFLRFANVETPEDLLLFVSRFGPLTDSVDKAGYEPVDEILRHSNAFRSWLSQGAQTERALNNWAGKAGRRLGSLDIFIVRDPAIGAPRFQYRPPHLLSALWLQLMRGLGAGRAEGRNHAAGEREYRECLYCGNWFEVGAGSGRRLDAKFCLDEHRILFNRRHAAKTKGKRG